MDLLDKFSAGLFLWQLILFVALLLLLKKYAWKPILDTVDEREKSIESALKGAEEAEKRMQALQADNEAAKREAMVERDAIMKEARDTRDDIISDAKNAASAEGAKIIAAAREEIEIQKKAAIADIKTQVASLSLDIAEKVVKQKLSGDASQKELVDTLLNETKLN
ncbi:MAG: F0F1 ATP synthase subunit B [Flavobacteriales bacterium]